MPQTQTSSPTSTATQAPVVIKRTFHAPRERVFRAWTDAPELAAWFAPSDDFMIAASSDLQIGGGYRISMTHVSGAVHTVTGTYREIKTPEKLVYTWQWETNPDPVETLVTIDFRAQGDSTEVTLTHELLPSEESRAKHTEGWNGCFDRLARFIDTGSGSGGVSTTGVAKSGSCGV